MTKYLQMKISIHVIVFKSYKVSENDAVFHELHSSFYEHLSSMQSIVIITTWFTTLIALLVITHIYSIFYIP
mgnify:CR=1 FL=1